MAKNTPQKAPQKDIPIVRLIKYLSGGGAKKEEAVEEVAAAPTPKDEPAKEIPIKRLFKFLSSKSSSEGKPANKKKRFEPEEESDLPTSAPIGRGLDFGDGEEEIEAEHVRRARKAQAQATKPSKKEQSAKPVYDTQNVFGRIKWSTVGTPEQIRDGAVSAHDRQSASITVPTIVNGEPVSFEIAIFGQINEGERRNLQNIFQRKSTQPVPLSGIKSIHILSDLGAVLTDSGIPVNEVKAYTADSNGAVLLSRNTLTLGPIFDSTINAILDDEINYRKGLERGAKAQWKQFDAVRIRLEQSHEYRGSDGRAFYGYFRNKPVIDMNSPVIGGIYLCNPAREATFVDGRLPLINAAFDEFSEHLRDSGTDGNDPEKALGLLSEFVQSRFTARHEEALKRLLADQRVSPDDELTLDTFLKYQTGGAEQLTLLAAYLIERAKKEQALGFKGSISVDRNWIPGGGNTWLRYWTSPKDVYILDAQLGYVGRLDDHSRDRWCYERPDELKQPRRLRPIL